MSYREETCDCPHCEGCIEVAVYDHPRRPPPFVWWGTIVGEMARVQGMSPIARARWMEASRRIMHLAENMEMWRRMEAGEPFRFVYGGPGQAVFKI